MSVISSIMTSLGLMQSTIDSHDAIFKEMQEQADMSRRQLFATAAAIPVMVVAANGESTKKYVSTTGGASGVVEYRPDRSFSASA